jgi:putative FmdB family regulatory protein
MPTYEYTCRDCAHRFEVVQSMWDEPLTMCPECGGSLRKVFAPPAISFKGSGFYATDHRKKPSESSGERAKDGRKDAKDAGAKKGTDAAGGDAGGAEPAATSTSSKKEPAAS